MAADPAVAERARAALAALLALRDGDSAGASADDLAKRWGGVYYDKDHDPHGVGGALSRLQADALREFGGTNALYPGTWPSVATMQAELIAYVARLVDGGAGAGAGVLASGGTESILLAALAAREAARARGVARPRIVASATAHPAIHKAAFLFGMELDLVPPDPATQRLRREDVEAVCGPSVALIYASAPSFPHGVVDDIRGLAELAAARGCGLHVDNCLGGVLLQHLLRAGALRAAGAAAAAAEPLRLRGVTSVSVDLHKYGYCSKGASVVVFRDAALRRRAFHPIVAVPGGAVSGANYVTATVQGARGGGPIAAAWATVRCMAGDGYLAAARRLHGAFAEMRAGVAAAPGLRLIGDSELCILAFTAGGGAANRALAKAMRARGWALSANENPPSLSICVGEQHVTVARAFVADLLAACRAAPAPLAAAAGSTASAPAPYQAAAPGAGMAQMREKLLDFAGKGLDAAPGLPSSRL